MNCELLDKSIEKFWTKEEVLSERRFFYRSNNFRKASIIIKKNLYDESAPDTANRVWNRVEQSAETSVEQSIEQSRIEGRTEYRLFN